MAAHISNTNVLNSNVVDNRLPEFVFHVSKSQSNRITCGDIFRSLHLVFASKCMRSIHLHTWHIVGYFSYTIDIFQTGRHYLTFRITREKELLNRGFVPIQPGLNIKQMGLFLKKCDATIKHQGNNYFPVFISKPAHIWNRQGHEIRLLRLENQLIVHVIDGDKRFETIVDHRISSPERVNYLAKKCLIKLDALKKVSFFEIQHQWQWKETAYWTEKRSYEIKLLRQGDNLFWHVLNTGSGYEGWKEFERKKESDSALWSLVDRIFKMPKNTRVYTFNCSSSAYYKPDTDVIEAYRTIDEVITQIKDFTFESIRRENPLEISIKPAITAKSEIDWGVTTVSKFSYAVSITMGPEGVDGNHARIIVEGIMSEDFEPDENHGLRPGDYFLHASHLLNENDIRTRYSERPNFSKRTPIWICSAEKVKAMIRRIQQAKNKPIKFDLYGDPRQGYNCFTWARERLIIDLGIIPKEISFGEKSLTTHLISLVARPGNNFARPNDAYYKMPPPR